MDGANQNNMGEESSKENTILDNLKTEAADREKIRKLLLKTSGTTFKPNLVTRRNKGKQNTTKTTTEMGGKQKNKQRDNDQIIKQLRDEIVKLQEQIQRMQNEKQINLNNNRFHPLNLEVEEKMEDAVMDDTEKIIEENNKDDDWETVLRNKNNKFKNTHNKDLTIESHSTNDDNMKTYKPNRTPQTEKRAVASKPPPINILGQNPKDTIHAMRTVVKTDRFAIKRYNEQLYSLKTESYEDYQKTVGMLKSLDAQYYTYTPKEEKQQTMLIKGLDNCYTPEEVLQLLKEKETSDLKFNQVTRFSTARSRQQNKLLPIFLVQISPESKLGKLHELKYLEHQIISWENLRKTTVIQCKNCQRFNHTASNCNMAYRCVKCKTDHGPNNCPLKLTEEVRDKSQLYCVLCKKQGHPATYRGCPVYKQHMASKKGHQKENMQKTQNATDKARSITTHPVSVTNSIPKKSYSDSFKTTQPNQNYGNSNNQDLTAMFRAMQQEIRTIIDITNTNSAKIHQLFEIIDKTLRHQNV